MKNDKETQRVQFEMWFDAPAAEIQHEIESGKSVYHTEMFELSQSPLDEHATDAKKINLIDFLKAVLKAKQNEQTK